MLRAKSANVQTLHLCSDKNPFTVLFLSLYIHHSFSPPVLEK